MDELQGINISASRYDELLRAETNLNTIKGLYYSDIATYDYEKFLAIIFGEKGADGNVE